MVKRDFYEVVVAWNRRKDWHNFCQLYKVGFAKSAWFGFRLWRILRNTVSGRYRDIERDVHIGVAKVVD